MKNKLQIKVQVTYLSEQSQPNQQQYVYSYTISIRNQGENQVQLLSRHWLISDETGKIEEIFGKGILGEQPYISPNETLKYTSNIILKTPTGTMKGNYQFINQQNELFEQAVNEFVLSKPYTLH
jgi:ApaG protein